MATIPPFQQEPLEGRTAAAGEDSAQGKDSRPKGVACWHCGLGVPAGLVDPNQAEQFCCAGCRMVYGMIHGCGLERFYRIRTETAAEASPARSTQRKYGEMDDTVFRELYYQPLSDGSQSVELYLEGVHCAACVWLIEKLPRVLGGVLEARLDMRRALVWIRWEEPAVRLSQIARTLDSLGYPPHPAKDSHARELRRQESHRYLIRIGVAAACAGNVMLLAFALYGGVFTGIEAQYSGLFRRASMLFGLVALAWPGSVFFRGAWAALRTRSAQLDLPIALGLAAGGVAGTANAVLGRGEIYFDSVTALVLLLLVGRWLQSRQQYWANDALELLFSLTPTSVRRIEGEEVEEVPIEAVAAGDLVEVRSGETIPADGTVAEGDSAIDRSLLTGESEPMRVGPGGVVNAGTVNLGSRLAVRVQSVGQETRIGNLMRLVEQYSRGRAPIVQFADRVAGWFVVVVVFLAAITLAAWLWIEPSRAIDNAVSLLIVTCPCALGLATPLAVTIALGRAARRQILIKGGGALELLGRRGTMFLDKTGTITAGRTAVITWSGDEAIRPLVAALERHSAHPIALALGAASPQPDSACMESMEVSDVEQTVGGGITGRVCGHGLVVGSSKFVRERGIAVPEGLERAEREVLDAGRTPVLAAIDGSVAAVVGLGDPLRDGVAEAVGALRRLGWRVRILSGDHPRLVAAVGRVLGIESADSLGGMSPEEKVAEVGRARLEGPVVMVGDGVNDAAALSAASVGIAVHGGAEASLMAAQVYLGRPGLGAIVELVHAARNTLGSIHRSFAVSLGYNILAAGLAMAGLISPLLAAILMPISSFTVLVLTFGSRTFGKSR